MEERKKACVTGGAGFIGSHIVEELIKNSIDVIVIDDFSAGKKENLRNAQKLAFENGCSIKIRELNLATTTIDKILDCHVDYIFHCAAKISVIESMEFPTAHSHNNILGTINLLEACRKHKISRFIYSSSAAVYGDNDCMPLVEMLSEKPISHYGFAKKSVEDLIKMYSKLYNMKYIILRYFNVYGPRQNLEGGYAAVIPAFINGALKNKELTVYGDGKQTRSFIFVKDIAKINFEIAEKIDRLSGNTIYNVCDEKHQSVEDILFELDRIFGKNINFSYALEREGEIKHSVGSAKKLNDIGIKTDTSFIEGLRETIEYYRNSKV